jgi:hypothetical protein
MQCIEHARRKDVTGEGLVDGSAIDTSMLQGGHDTRDK